MALAAVAAASCGRGPPSSEHARNGRIPDPAREALLQSLEQQAGKGSREAVRTGMRVTAMPSGVVPALVYVWGAYAAADGRSYRALVASSGGRPTPIRTPHDWSASIWPVGWSPASVHTAAVACAEVAWAAGAHPDPADAVYRTAADARRWGVADSAVHRLHPPQVTRRELGRWLAAVWLREPGVISRYRCLFAPRTGHRGPLAEFARTDSISDADPRTR